MENKEIPGNLLRKWEISATEQNLSQSEFIIFIRERQKEYFDSLETSEKHKVMENGQLTDYGKKVAQAVVNGEVDRGIAICGTGVGIGLACNKVKGIRACTCSEPYSAEYSRRHNNANIITFGARVIGIETAKQIVDVFMKTEFEGGRHERRVDQLMDIEARNCAK